jgi:hypothetical protein
MPERLGGSAHSDRNTQRALACWPRLLDIHPAAQYFSVGVSTIRDYVADRILQPVEMPGSTIRGKSGKIVAHSKARKIAKILIDKADLDALIDERKARNERI